MSLFKFIVNKLKCNSSCSMNEEYCPDKCKEYFENISNMELNSKDLKKIYLILHKSPSVIKSVPE
mgnify:FL=1